MKKMSRWIVYGTASALLLLGALLALPFLVDFNRFKPQLQGILAEHLNAKVDFESARLTLVTGLGIRFTKVSVENTDKDFNGTKLLSVDEIVFYTHLFPLLEQRFVGVVAIDAPEIVIANKGLASNLTSLARPAKDAGGQAPPVKKTPEQIASEKALIEKIKKDVVIEELRVSNARLTLQERGGKANTVPVRVEDLDLTIRNIGVDRDIVAEIRTVLGVDRDGIRVKGPLAVDSTLRVSLAGEALKTASFQGRVSFDGADLNVRDAFVKATGVPLNLAFKGEVKPDALALQDVRLNLHTLALKSRLQLLGFKALKTDASIELESMDIGRLGDLLPQHKSMLVNGSVSLRASLVGLLSKPEGVKAKVSLKTKLKGSDLNVEANAEGISPPRGALTVRSQRLDLGGMLKPFLGKPGAVAPPAPAVVPPPAQKGDPRAVKTPLGLTAAQRKALDGARFNVDIALKEILYGKIKVSGFAIKARQESLVSSLDLFALKAMETDLSVKANANLAQTPVPIKADIQVKSPKIDIGALQRELGLESPPTTRASPASPAASTPPAQPAVAKSGAAQDVVPGLPPELKRVLQGLDVTLGVNVGQILYNKFRVDGFALNVRQAGLVSNLERFSARTLGMNIDVSANANLATTPPTVKLGLGLKGKTLDVDALLADLGVKIDKEKKNSGENKSAKGGNGAPRHPAAGNEPPPKDFELSPAQKKLLKHFSIALDIGFSNIRYDTIRIADFVLKARQEGVRMAVENFGLNAFGGAIGFKGQADLGKSPIAFNGATALKQVRVEQLIGFIKPEHKDVLKGSANIDLAVAGQGTTVPTLSKTLNGKGTFAFLEGQINSGSIIDVVQGKLDGFIKGLSVTAVAENSFKEAERILANPVVAKLGLAGKFDVAKQRAEFDRIKTVRVSSKARVDSSLKDLKGGLEIKNGRIHVTSTRLTPQGELKLNSSVGLDLSLAGGGFYDTSPQVKQSMSAQSKHSPLLFDEAGKLALALGLGGTVQAPTVSVNLDALRDRFVKNARAAVETQVRQAAKDFVDQAVKGRADAALAELRRKEAEARARAEAEVGKRKAEAQARIDAEKQKLEVEKQKREAAARQKAKDEAGKVLNKDKLKGFLGR